MKKRGQVTVFIILGILLLFLALLYLFTSTTYTEKIEGLFLPEELIPLKNYVEECVKDTGKDGAVLLGQQGGYIEIPELITIERASYMSFAKGLVKIPYWNYNGENRIPTDEFVANQLSIYMNKHINECIDGFSQFNNQYGVVQKGEIKTETTFTKEGISFNVVYPIEITNKGNKKIVKLSTFSSELTIPLSDMLLVSRSIMSSENAFSYIENITLEIMSINPNIPFTGMKFHCSPLVWKLKDIKTELQQIMRYTLPQVRIKNTDYVPFEADEKIYEEYRQYGRDLVSAYEKVATEPLETYDERLEKEVSRVKEPNSPVPEDIYDYGHYFFDSYIEKEYPFKASFVYSPEFGMSINAYPSEDGMLSSRMMKGSQKYLGFLCINAYHFTYDVMYPVQVVMSDETALNNEGYVFRFAFPVIIKSNEAERDSKNTEIFDVPAQETGFCNILSGKKTTIKVKGMDDYGDMVSLRNANISYQCMTNKCYLGKTQIEGRNIQLSANLPESCSNPWIIVQKEGYAESKFQVTSQDEGYKEIELIKYITLNLTVLKHPYFSTDGYTGPAQEFTDKDEALIYIHSPALKITQTLKYPFENDTPEDLTQIKIAVQDETYNLNIIYTNGDRDFTGGYYNNNWTLHIDDLFDETGFKNKITLHVFDYRPTPLPFDKNTDEDLDTTQTKFIQYYSSGEYKEQLKPEIE